MPHGACHPPRGTRPDVYARSWQKTTLRSLTSPGYIKWCPVWWRIQAPVSPRSRRTQFRLCARKANEDIRIEESAVFVRPSHRHLCADWPGFLPAEMQRVINCATCLRPPDDVPHRYATRWDTSSHDKIAASKASCGMLSLIPVIRAVTLSPSAPSVNPARRETRWRVVQMRGKNWGFSFCWRSHVREQLQRQNVVRD